MERDKMIYCFDVDGTICTITENHEYYKAKPIPEMVKKINRLYDEGHTIKIATSRGKISGMEFHELARRQLQEWGIPYHELHIKPPADFYIDDLAMTPGEFILGRDDDIIMTNEKRGFSGSVQRWIKNDGK